MDLLLQISRRIWVTSRGWVRWEGHDGQVRAVYVANSVYLMQRAYALGWQGGHQVFGVNYLWSPRFETGQTQEIVSYKPQGGYQ